MSCLRSGLTRHLVPLLFPPFPPAQDFEWSPAEPVIAAYTAEQNQMPARIVLIRIPDRWA
jgi:hypothetical protein